MLRTALSYAQAIVPADAIAVWSARHLESFGLESTRARTIADATSLLPVRAFLPDVATSKGPIAEHCLRERIVSALVLPLNSGAVSIGCLAFYWRSPVSSADDFIEPATALANMTAMALSRATLDGLYYNLTQSERLYRETFERASVGIAHLSFDAQWTAFNDRLLEIIGYSREELSQLTFKDITHPADIEASLLQFEAMRQGHIRRYSMEKRYIHKRGHIVWAYLTCSAVCDEHKNPAYCVAVIEDISARVNAESALRGREREERMLLENMPDIVTRYSPDLRCKYISPRVRRLLGLSSDHLIGKNHQEIGFPPHLCQQFDQALHQIFATGKPDSLQFSLADARGEVRHYTSLGIPEFDEDERVVSVLTITRDQTEVQNAEAEVRRRDKELRLLIDTVPALLAYIDCNERFLRVNRLFEQWFGGKLKRFLGKTIREILGETNYHNVEPFIRTVLSGESVQFETSNLYADKPRNVLVTYTPDLDESGEVRGFAALVQDVTLRRAAEDALRKSEKLAAAGRLAASISHEINNPLESVTNLLYLIEHHEALAPSLVEYVRTAQQELTRVTQIATQTLRFYRQSTRPAKADISATLESVLALYASRLDSAHIEVIRHFDSPCPIVCFEGELRQVFANLVSNALDAMSASGGRLMVRTRNAVQHSSGAPGIRVTICDTGHGMTDETRMRIFEPFFTTKGMTGTGLGLWISSEIITKHKGTFQVRSCHSGHRRGTAFSIFLPSQFLLSPKPA